MSHNIASLKPLFLTEEEALALLDMTLMSASENDPAKERAMLKLTDLARRYLTTEGNLPPETSAQETDSRPVSTTPLFPAFIESELTAERNLEKSMSQHTGRAYFGRYRRRKPGLACVS